MNKIHFRNTNIHTQHHKQNYDHTRNSRKLCTPWLHVR